MQNYIVGYLVDIYCPFSRYMTALYSKLTPTHLEGTVHLYKGQHAKANIMNE